MNLIVVAIAWMAGVVIADLAGVQATFTWPLAGIGVLFGGVGLLIRRRTATHPLAGPNWAAHIVLACAAATLAAARLAAVQIVDTPQGIWHLADTGEVVVQGWVSSDPKRSEDGQQLVLQVESVTAGSRSRPQSGLVLVGLPVFPERHYGDRLVLTGKLSTPRGPDRPGGFDYRAYLRRKGILVRMSDPRAKLLPEQRGLAFLRALLAFRDRCKEVMLHELPEPQSSIAIGVLLGLQSSIPDEVYNTFSVTGTSHILVVSGWNFTIVAAMLAGITGRLRLGRGFTLAASLAVLWVYALFVGATGTVLRAAVMASLAVLARATDRRGEAWTLLAAACGGLAVYDPYVLWDLGFQLSALATASLFAYGTPVANLLSRIPVLNQPWMEWASEALTATLAAQVLALPIILYHFGNLSLIAPLANILLVPVVPYIMLLCTLALVGGLIWLPLGQGLALAAWLPLTWLTEGARLLSQVSWAATQLPPFPLWMLLAYYAVTVGGWWWVVSEELVQGSFGALEGPALGAGRSGDMPTG